MGAVSPVFRPQAGKGQNVAIGATSTTCATAFGAQTHAIQVSATSSCHIEIGQNPTATATSMLVKASDPPLVLRVAPGEKLAVIQDTAAGTLNIAELTH